MPRSHRNKTKLASQRNARLLRPRSRGGSRQANNSRFSQEELLERLRYFEEHETLPELSPPPRARQAQPRTKQAAKKEESWLDSLLALAPVLLEEALPVILAAL